MTISEFAKKIDATILHLEKNAETREISGCYIGDLLSRVISRAKRDGVWITIMPNVNVAAVALLAEVSCVLLAEGVVPDEALVQKCREEDITLLKSEQDAYTLAIRTHGLFS